jgi:uncharacterized membrane-anchored protein
MTQIIVPLTPGAYIYSSQWNPHHFWLATIADSVAGKNTSSLYLTDLQGRTIREISDVIEVVLVGTIVFLVIRRRFFNKKN